METYNLCIIKPNKAAFSETFLNEHINRLKGKKKVLYGGAFPLFDHNGKYLIKSKLQLLNYLFQKRILKKKNIKIRTNALVHYLKEQQVDVVLAEYGMVGGLVTEACRIANVPLIVHFHGADAHHKETVQTYISFYREAFEYARFIVAVSLDMIETLVELGAPRNKLIFIPCGVDIDRFLPVNITADKNFLFIGRFVPKKAPDELVKAFAKVVNVVPEAKLWMVGNGPLWADVKELIIQLNLQNNIFLTGVKNQEEIRSLMKQSRCFVQHSVTAANGDMEGTPVTILEAGASALPIISTKHAGIKQAVLDGVSGFLVDEHDTETMARKMIEVAQMSTTELMSMGAEGRKHIIANYSIQNQIGKLDAIIQSCVNKN